MGKRCHKMPEIQSPKATSLFEKKRLSERELVPKQKNV